MPTENEKNTIPFYNPFEGDIPWRGPHKLYKWDEPTETKPKLFREPRVKVLSLNKEEDLQEYQEALSLCANGRALLMQEKINYDQEEHTYRVFLSYIELYLEDAEHAKQKILKLG